MENVSVLLVDDEIDFLQTLIKRLKKRGIQVQSAASGEEALDILSRTPVDVVVLDVRMPGMDGIETLREIKKRDPLTEVIMLTGHASVEVAISGMALGAFDYLMKPMDIDELVYKLQDAYRQRALQQDKIRHVETELDRSRAGTVIDSNHEFQTNRRSETP